MENQAGSFLTLLLLFCYEGAQEVLIHSIACPYRPKQSSITHYLDFSWSYLFYFSFCRISTVFWFLIGVSLVTEEKKKRIHLLNLFSINGWSFRPIILCRRTYVIGINWICNQIGYTVYRIWAFLKHWMRVLIWNSYLGSSGRGGEGRKKNGGPKYI